jgi:malate dehydrogenase (oxaloacetate-decarboxylating)
LRDFQKPCAKSRAQLGVSAGERVGPVEAFKIAAPAWSDGESPVATGSPSVPVDLPNR